MDDFARGMFTAMSEFGQPFISESIWTEAVLDIIARKGQTRDGFQVYNEQDNSGDKACLLYTSPSPRDGLLSRMPSSA